MSNIITKRPGPHYKEDPTKRAISFGTTVKLDEYVLNSKCCEDITGVECKEEKEMWKRVPGSQRHFISNHGVLRIYTGDVLNNKNRSRRMIYYNNQEHDISIPRVIYKTFVGETPFDEDYILYHNINHNDSHVTNLCWFPGKDQRLSIIKHLKDKKLEGVNWKSLSPYGYTDYKISDTGTVYNPYNIALAGYTNSAGYVRVDIKHKDDMYKNHVKIHYLVALAFLPPRPSPEHTLDHMNRVRDDNAPTNIRWATKSEQRLNQNRSHCIQSGRAVIKMDLQGNVLKKYRSIAQIAKDFNLTYVNSVIVRACEEKTPYRDYLWKFYNPEEDEEFKEWKRVPIEGIEIYASNHGCIKHGNIYTFGYEENGYLRVSYKINGEAQSFAVHRLVALAFLGPPPDSEMVVNHKDLNKQYNDILNLEYLTERENVQHGVDNGAYRDDPDLYSRPVRQYKGYKFIKEYPSVAAAGKGVNCHATAISQCCIAEKHLSAGGFQWVHADQDYIEYCKENFHYDETLNTCIKRIDTIRPNNA